MSIETQQATRFDLMCVTDDLNKDVSEVRNQLDELRGEYEEYARHESGNRDEVWERLEDLRSDVSSLDDRIDDLDVTDAFDDLRHDVRQHDDRLDDLEGNGERISALETLVQEQGTLIDALLDQLEARNR